MRFNPVNWLWKRAYEKLKGELAENGYSLTNERVVSHTFVRDGDEQTFQNDPELSSRLLLRPRVFGGYLSGESIPLEHGKVSYPTLDRRYRELSLNGILTDRPAGIVIYNTVHKRAAILMRV